MYVSTFAIVTLSIFLGRKQILSKDKTTTSILIKDTNDQHLETIFPFNEFNGAFSCFICLEINLAHPKGQTQWFIHFLNYFSKVKI